MPFNQRIRDARPHRAAVGQSVSEYAIIGALITVICLPALVLLNGHFNQDLQGFTGALSKQSPVIKTLHAPTAGGSPVTNTAASAVSLSTANGVKIQLSPELSLPLSQTITTLGANGSTTLLANNIQAIAQELLATGAITEQQYNALTKLSNQGHLLAEMMGAMDEAAQRKEYASTDAFFYEEPIYVNGQKTTPYDVWNQLGYLPPDGAYKYATPDRELPQGQTYTEIPADPLQPPRPASSTMQKFIDLYSQANQSGALQDPTVKAVVEHLSQQIALTTEAVVQAHGDAFMHYTPISQAASGAASKVTHVDSAGICSVGQGTDSGVHCAS